MESNAIRRWIGFNHERSLTGRTGRMLRSSRRSARQLRSVISASSGRTSAVTPRRARNRKYRIGDGNERLHRRRSRSASSTSSPASYSASSTVSSSSSAGIVTGRRHRHHHRRGRKWKRRRRRGAILLLRRLRLLRRRLRRLLLLWRMRCMSQWVRVRRRRRRVNGRMQSRMRVERMAARGTCAVAHGGRCQRRGRDAARSAGIVQRSGGRAHSETCIDINHIVINNR